MCLYITSVHLSLYLVIVQFVSHVQLFATPWTAAHQTSLSITNSQSLLKLMSIESVTPSNHLILCRPLLLQPSIVSSIRLFSRPSVSRGQSIGASASVLPLNSQGWFPLQLTILICYPPTQLSDLCIYASMCLIYYLSAYLSIYLVGKLITVYTSIMYLVYSCIHLAIMYLSSTNIIIYHP